MKLFTVKNNETGETKGLDLTATLDLTYFDAVQEYINHNPDEFTDDEVKVAMGGWDIGIYTDFQNELDQLDKETVVGRYTVTPLA
jgi:hypothetical protein